MEAIETRYAGHRFRSRLEARWAVLFDVLGIRWHYEHEGYQVPRWRGSATHTSYLPDFELPDDGLLVEVKGDNVRLDKALLLDVADRQWSRGPRNGLLVLGPVPRPSPNRLPAHTLLTASDRYGQPVRGRGVWHRRAIFTARGTVELALVEDCWSRMSMESDPCECDWIVPAVDVYSHAVSRAYIAARSARFEHGESGGEPW